MAVTSALVASAAGLAGCRAPWTHSPAPPPPPPTSSPAPGPSGPPAPSPSPTVWHYTVAPGDYFDGIAWADGVTPARLQALNPQIADTHWINPGDVITLPQPLQQTPPKLPPSPSCDGGLTVTEGQPDGFAGHVSLSFTVTNRLSVACTLRGYPGFEPVTPRPVDVERGGGQSTATPPSQVIVPPGGTTQFRVEWTDVTDNPAQCLDVRRVRVTLPGQFTTQKVDAGAVPIAACPPGPAALPKINVGPVTTPGY